MRLPMPVLATSLFDDVAAALREHGSATLDEHFCYFRRPTESWPAVVATCAAALTDCPVMASHAYAL